MRQYAILLIAVVLCPFLGSCPKSSGVQYSDSDLLKALEEVAPEGWTTQIGDPGHPMLWQGNAACRSLHFVNPTVTHTEPRGGFDYNPFHDMWLCPPGFLGSQYPIGMVEASYPANYVADGPAGILFALSLGRNDWENADEAVAEKLGMQKPRKDPQTCEKALNSITGLEMPEGIEIQCNSVTDESIFMSLKTFEGMSFEDVDKITDNIARRLKKAFPEKTRMVISRIHNHVFDAVIVGFSVKFEE